MRSTVSSRSGSPFSKPPSKGRRRSICRISPRQLAPASVRRSRPRIPSEPWTSLRPRLELQGQRDFALWKRSCSEVKASALLSLDAAAAEAAANEGYELAQELDLGPKQGHGLRILGDIIAAKGDKTKADELHGLARAKYRSLGMKRWAESPWRCGDEPGSPMPSRCANVLKGTARLGYRHWRKYPAAFCWR